MNSKKYTLFSFLNFLVVFCAWAQQKTVSVGADKQTVKLFFEKSYLQADRSYYGTGEDIWFSAYLVNGKSSSLTSTSNNLYVELLSPESEILDRKMIRLDGGLGKGDFKLKDSIPSGWYGIRAYTNWMRNFGDDFVFLKRVYISNNRIENAALFTGSTAHASNPKKSIAFFPEGGALVEGLTGIVAFKTNDDAGNGVKATGSVISAHGDTVTTFRSTEAGMGIFAFTPRTGEKYKVEGFYGKEKFSSELPVILKKGLSLHVTTDSVTVKATISANEPMFNELKDKNISVVIKHAGDNIYTGSIRLSKAIASVSIPTKGFPKGISSITLFDDANRPNCERLVFIQDDNQVDFTVIPGKPIYKPREQAVIKVKATNALGKPVKTAFSFAAVDGLVPDDGNNIVSYLMLQSEVKGEIKNAAQYFDVKNPSRLKQLDLLLLTQGWRDYIWKKLADSAIKISYLPEPGITVKGLVREKLADKPIPNMNITLFGTNFTGNKIFTTKTDQNGRYFFDGLSWYDNQMVKISSKDDKGKKGGWLQIDTLVKPLNLAPLKTISSVIPNTLNVEIKKRMDYNRTYKFGDSISLNDIEIKAAQNNKVNLFQDVLTSFGYPEQVFNITAADYSYKGLEHFLLTKAKGSYPAEENDTLGNEGVTFIANGKKVRPVIKVNNREELFTQRLDYYSLTMDQINQVKIQHLLNSSGKDVYLISLNLKDEALRGPNLDLLNLNLNGYYAARTFYSPNYSHPATPNKDLRTTIFWSPSVKTNENGEATITYFNGDNRADILIKTDGITDKGVAVSAKTTYKVQ
ncbi:MAG: carboxypeptidase regulatory-like domain-containing protein [Sphingobacteriaceae bacterium]|nr:carboxypeptidase regulatory-like domain-containing protein [Sphingobacteriaceae bacterium]